MIAMLLGALRLALGAIARNKLRAGLTVLGIFIGITAVVIVTAAGNSAAATVGGEIDSLAANGLFVFPQPVQASGARSKFVGRLTEADARAIAHGAVSVSAVSPWLLSHGQAAYGDQEWYTTLAGAFLAHPPIRLLSVAPGTFLRVNDERL